MRVVFVNRFCHPDHSATSQILSDLAAGLAAGGMSVAMIASRMRYDEPAARLPHSERWRGVDIHRVWTSRFGRESLLGRAIDYLTFYLSVPGTLLRVVARGDVVVVKTDPPLVSLLVGMICRARGASMINWLQDVFPEVAVALGQPRVPGWLAYVLKWLRNRSLRSAVANVAIGERMAEFLLQQGADPKRLRVIPNWALEEAIHPVQPEDTALRRELGIGEQFVVGYSGNLGRAHDTDTIFQAATLLAENPKIALLIMGAGHGHELLRRQVIAAQLPNVHFRGYSDLASISDSMASADLHLVSLRPELEGLIVPSKLYGIAASSRAVGFIGDPDGEVARWIIAARCGFTVLPSHADALAHEILMLEADRPSCVARGGRARALLDAKFSRKTAHATWRELLDDLA